MTLEEEFDAEMHRIYEEAKRRCNGYRGTRFIRMIREHGGLHTALRLLDQSGVIHDGLADLFTCGCLDLTAEHLALEPRFSELFDDAQKAEAKRRLGRE
ncbi:MAG: hypothetical protein KDA75_18035 [Planctomycetaceae bacterium]|nr:hypothetical protein [Planctomycetaceae bacterium]